MKKERLDILLMNRGLFASRERARSAIMAGKILVNENKIDKPGTGVADDCNIRILGEVHRFVSRGGLKLEKALNEFDISLEGKVMADIGASTGGFTDCALQAGARKVYAIDVGYGQLDWKIRQDPRVIVWERTNIRNVEPSKFDELIDFISIDVSFISLRLVLPVAQKFLAPAGQIVCLIKPQFEAGRERLGKNGVVRDPKIHAEILKETLELFDEIELNLKELTFSPITGPEGNIEFLAFLEHKGLENRIWQPEEIVDLVTRAHQSFEK